MRRLDCDGERERERDHLTNQQLINLIIFQMRRLACDGDRILHSPLHHLSQSLSISITKGTYLDCIQKVGHHPFVDGVPLFYNSQFRGTSSIILYMWVSLRRLERPTNLWALMKKVRGLTLTRSNPCLLVIDKTRCDGVVWNMETFALNIIYMGRLPFWTFSWCPTWTIGHWDAIWDRPRPGPYVFGCMKIYAIRIRLLLLLFILGLKS